MRQRSIVTDFSVPAKPKPPRKKPPPDDGPEPRGLSKAERYHRTHKLLVTRFRRIFRRPRPLAIGIHEQLRAAFREDQLSSRALHEFLVKWTKRPPYTASIARGDRRVHLNGRDAGPAVRAPQEAE